MNAFAALCRLMPDAPKRLILDAGCGTGMSTRMLADRYPEHTVIGVDRSAIRLRKAGWTEAATAVDNCIFVRARLESFWRLARAAGWQLSHHFLLYPNPWPKPAHLGRRWHAHPVFGDILTLGGLLEMRCNWRIYAEEFAMAVNAHIGQMPGIERITGTDPISRFEAKYAASGHDLYRVRVRAGQASPREPEPRATTRAIVL